MNKFEEHKEISKLCNELEKAYIRVRNKYSSFKAKNKPIVYFDTKFKELDGKFENIKVCKDFLNKKIYLNRDYEIIKDLLEFSRDIKKIAKELQTINNVSS